MKKKIIIICIISLAIGLVCFSACRKNREARLTIKEQLFSQELLSNSNQAKVDELLSMVYDGKTEDEINEYAKTELLADGLPENILKSFANQGYTPANIYVLENSVYRQMILDTLEGMEATQNKLFTEQIWLDYKEKNISFGFPHREPPEDFIYGDLFTDKSDWDNMEFGVNEYGYSFVDIPSADNKYIMTISFDKAEYKYLYAEGKYSFIDPDLRYVTFSFGPAFGVPEDYPAVDVIKSGNAVISANILTEKITFSMSTSSTPEAPKFNKTMFLCMINYIDEIDFCYHNIFPLMPDTVNTQFKITNMEKVIRQVFGDYKWSALKDFGTPPNGDYNEERQSYEFSTDFGWGFLFYGADNITSSFSADGRQVYSDFDMSGPDPSVTTDPAYKSYGRYRAVYDIITEDDETFLRFNGFEKL